jgi:nicotinate-nucleotide adenylyltransferase
VSPTPDRLAMTRLAIQDNSHFTLSLDDINRPTPHYVAGLFELLTQAHPNVEWFMIVGGDSLAELPHWYRPARILELIKLAVAQRPGFEPDVAQLERALPGVRTRLVWLDSPPIELASHDLQRRAREGLPLRYVVPEAVLDYIRTHHLYQAEPGRARPNQPESP